MRRVLVLLAAVAGTFAQANLATIVGFTDAGVEQNGKIVRIEVSAQVDVRVEGTYRLIFDLIGAGGGRRGGRVSAPLEVGRQTLTASFDARQVWEYLESDGPYRISDVRLFRDTGFNGTSLAYQARDGGATRAYRIADLYREPAYFTGEVDAVGVEPTPAGKFQFLRVSFGIVSEGGWCSVHAMLRGPDNREIEFAQTTSGQPVPAGAGTVTLDYYGPKIARSGIDGQFIVSGLRLFCDSNVLGNRRYVEDRRRSRSVIRSSEFDDPAPDFVFLTPQQTVHIAPGDPFYSNISVRLVGVGERVQVQATSPDPRVKVQGPEFAVGCSEVPSCWRNGQPFLLSVPDTSALPPGTYTIHVTGRAGGLEHNVDLSLIVDPQVALTRQRRAAAVEDLARPDPIPAVPDAVPDSKPVAADFTAGVTLRKIHAVLVLDRSSSLGLAGLCDLEKASAIRFSQLFVPERDWFGAVSFGAVVETMMPLTDQFQSLANGTISKMVCSGYADTARALETAEKELINNADPEAINVVVLFTDGPPGGITAVWPVKPPEGRSNVCQEARDGVVSATMVPTTIPAILDLHFIPVFTPAKDEGMARMRGSTNLASCFSVQSVANYAYLPEEDSNGIRFEGTRPLERFPDGPYAGKIRLRLAANVNNAVRNAAENAAQRLRSGPAHAYIYAVGVTGSVVDPVFREFVGNMANDPRSRAFRTGEAAGRVFLPDSPEAVWPAFEQVRKEIVDRATVR